MSRTELAGGFLRRHRNAENEAMLPQDKRRIAIDSNFRAREFLANRENFGRGRWLASTGRYGSPFSAQLRWTGHKFNKFNFFKKLKF